MGCRGTIETPLLDQAMNILDEPKQTKIEAAIGRNGSAEEVANVIVFLLSDAAAFVTGSIYSCDGGCDC